MTNKPDIQCTSVYPTISVPDILKTVKYYENQLGFESRFLWGAPPTHRAVSLGEATIHFTPGEPNFYQLLLSAQYCGSRYPLSA